MLSKIHHALHSKTSSWIPSAILTSTSFLSIGLLYSGFGGFSMGATIVFTSIFAVGMLNLIYYACSDQDFAYKNFETDWAAILSMAIVGPILGRVAIFGLSALLAPVVMPVLPAYIIWLCANVLFPAANFTASAFLGFCVYDIFNDCSTEYGSVTAALMEAVIFGSVCSFFYFAAAAPIALFADSPVSNFLSSCNASTFAGVVGAIATMGTVKDWKNKLFSHEVEEREDILSV